jgi:hypothetical protein
MLGLWIATALADDPSTVNVGGLVEAYYAYNLNNPANGVTALRGFDSRHDSAALSLAAVHVAVNHPTLRGRVALQAGATPASYFAAEPSTAGGFAVAPTDATTFRAVREAWVGGRAPVLGGLSVDGGVFLSPVGFDSIAVKDNRFWSLSNLGVGLPFYFTGARAVLDLDQGTVLTLGAFNGWNSVVDNNRGKSVALYATHTFASGASAQVLYLGGPELPTAGAPWRHTFDAWATFPVGPVTLLAGADAGLEARDAGMRSWQAGQLGADVTVDDWSFGVRGDVFREDGPDDALGSIFWPTPLLGEVTASAGFRPTDGLLVRLEARHDRAADPVFFGDDPTLPTETTQTTVTLGVTGWFDTKIPFPTEE